jgi:cytochrome c
MLPPQDKSGGNMRRAAAFITGLGLAIIAATASHAQMTLPAAKPPSGEDLFTRQCATCHTTKVADPQRQGPTLAGVMGRKAGSVAAFHYSPGFAKADWNWDAARLDAWLTDPQAVIPGAVMPYRQAKPEIRAAIIAYLKEVR